MKKKAMGLIVMLLSFFALANVASATTIFNYQPELPQSLKK